MPSDPQNALPIVQSGLAQLSTLIVSYSFSAVGAVILLVVGYIVAGLTQRSIYAGLGHIHGFDVTLRHFFSRIARYAILILVVIMVLGQFGVQTASIIAAIGAIGLAIGLALQVRCRTSPPASCSWRCGHSASANMSRSAPSPGPSRKSGCSPPR
ncbi:hypothetical protein GCM10010869_75160 [Mesorhizobium tianshanense]|nr:mechanosensitive ion channel [Mesorhizobium tianshanense]GLS41919.1 hypothetical protein GCM10010869_75160 [Mesorhizobium tianshanense]